MNHPLITNKRKHRGHFTWVPSILVINSTMKKTWTT